MARWLVIGALVLIAARLQTPALSECTSIVANIAVMAGVQVYFRDPRSPWQRGSNENTNGLLRQYLPRGTDFSRISQSYLNAIALRLNQRPRKTLGFQTPADRLQAVLH
jgi:IS30 family transposase